MEKKKQNNALKLQKQTKMCLSHRLGKQRLKQIFVAFHFLPAYCTVILFKIYTNAHAVKQKCMYTNITNEK